jgi:hypothetical protein
MTFYGENHCFQIFTPFSISENKVKKETKASAVEFIKKNEVT